MHTSKPPETESNKRSSPSPPDQQKKKRKVESVVVAKKPTAQLEKWATKRQELKGEADQQVSEFADLNQMCCLLCRRKFQSVEEIQKHEQMSKLHKVSLVMLLLHTN
jgi:hypothetical protein